MNVHDIIQELLDDFGIFLWWSSIRLICLFEQKYVDEMLTEHDENG